MEINGTFYCNECDSEEISQEVDENDSAIFVCMECGNIHTEIEMTMTQQEILNKEFSEDAELEDDLYD